MTTGAGTIKYGFAQDVSGQIVSIDQAEAKQHYTCISCGNKLTPVINVTKRQKHFRHAVVDAALACSLETYLHKLAKQRFYESYLNCLRARTPFFVTINTPKECIACSRGPCKIPSGSSQTVDLTEHFTEIFPPDSCFDGQFKPDILLRTPSGKSLWVEMVVTHWSDASKIASGTRIVEVQIDSEHTIDSFSTHKLDPKITTLHNFRKQPVSGDFRSECIVDLAVSAIYPNGRIRTTYKKMIDYKSELFIAAGALRVHAVEDNEYSLATGRPLLELLFRDRLKSVFCLMCVHYVWDYDKNKPFCLKNECHVPDPSQSTCSHYKPMDILPHSPDLTSVFHERWRDYEMLQFEIKAQKRRMQMLQLEKELQGSRTQVQINPQSPPEPQHLQSVEASTCRKCGKKAVYSQEGDWWLFNKGTGECECRECLRLGDD